MVCPVCREPLTYDIDQLLSAPAPQLPEVKHLLMCCSQNNAAFIRKIREAIINLVGRWFNCFHGTKITVQSLQFKQENTEGLCVVFFLLSWTRQRLVQVFSRSGVNSRSF